MKFEIKSFSAWLNESENEENQEKNQEIGTYVAVNVINADELFNFTSELCEHAEILPQPKEELHSTIAYSRKNFSDCYVPKEENTIITPNDYIKYDVFGDSLVLIYDSEEIKERNEATVTCGATSDYTEYTPHITIATVPEDFDKIQLQYMGLPDFDIILGNEYMEDLDLDK